MKILICLVTRMSNRGVDALVASKAAELARTFPGSEIDVLTRDGEVNAPLLSARGIGLLNDRLYGWRKQLLDRTGALSPLARRFGIGLFAEIEQNEAALRRYDLAVVTGGDNFSSDYGSPEQYLAPIRILLDAKIPVAILGQSIGPFREASHRDSFLSVATRCDLITVRETASLAYVRDELGLSENIALTADTAFLLEPSPRELARSMMASFGLDPEKPTIAFSISGGISTFAGADRDRHISALTRLSKKLLAETDAQLLLVPHVEDHSPGNNDLIACDAVLRSMNFHPRMRLAKGYLTSNDYKAIVGCCDMVIAERMHVAIAGLSQAVPTFVIGYSVKGHGIMTDCLGRDSVKSGLVTPLESFMASPEEDEKAIALWRNRDDIHADLSARLPGIKALAAKNFELVKEVFDARSSGERQ